MDRKRKANIDKSLFGIFFSTVVGAILRTYHLGFKPLWLDEAVLYWISNSENLKSVITQNALRNSTPPLFPILIRYITFIGDSEEMLRLLPLIAGVASIPAIYFLSRELINKFPAIIVSLIVAVAPTQIKYSQEVREYSLTFLLAILILLFFIKFLKRQNWKYLILMTTFMVLGILTQYGLSLLIISLNMIYLFILISEKQNRKTRLIKWVLSQIVTLTVALSVVYLSLRGQSHFFEAASSPNHYLYNAYWNGTIRSLFTFIQKNSYVIIKFSFSSNMFLFLTIIGFIFLILNIKYYSNSFLLFLVPMVLTILLAIFGLYPYHGDRQDIFLTPMIYLLAGFGINYLWELDKKRWATIILFSFPIFSGIIQSIDYLNSPGVENIIPIVNKLKESKEDDDSVYVYYAAKPAFDYYFRDQKISKVIYGTYNRGNVNKYFEEIDNVLKQDDSIWFVFSHCWMDECKLITDNISQTHQIDLIVSENNALLYFTD